MMDIVSFGSNSTRSIFCDVGCSSMIISTYALLGLYLYNFITLLSSKISSLEYHY